MCWPFLILWSIPNGLSSDRSNCLRAKTIETRKIAQIPNAASAGDRAETSGRVDRIKTIRRLKRPHRSEEPVRARSRQPNREPAESKPIRGGKCLKMQDIRHLTQYLPGR
jgi:hypothetical protein